MVKSYIDAMIRLDQSKVAISEKLKGRSNEAGFATAETIALAVAGVLIVSVMFGVFKTQIGTAMTNMFAKITSWTD